MSQPYPPQQYPQQQPGGYGYPAPPQQPSAGLAIAALVLGIVALLLSWIPIVNYLAVVLGVVGLVLGIIGVVKSRRTMSIIGAALSFVAIVASVIVVTVFANAVDEAVAELDTSISTGGTVEGGEESLDAEVEANADPAPDPAPGAATNSRGNIPKGLGEEGAIANADDVEVLTFAVDSITVDPACGSDWKEYGTPLEPGHHLVAVQLRVATTPLISEDDFLSVSSYDFKFIGADGITVDSLDSISTYGCLDDGQEFTSDLLGPGQTYAGAIVLDLPAASGTLVFAPSWGQTGGWEYGF